MVDWIRERLIVIVVIVLGVSLIGAIIYHEIKYVCLRGHYETQSYFDPNLKMVMTHEVWVCDEEMLREDYNKLNKEK